MKKQPQPEEITAMEAAQRLNMSRVGVIWAINHGHLTARKADAPTPYWLITIDDKFFAKEKARSQSKN